MRPRFVTSLVVLLLALSIALTGCTTVEPTYVEEGNSYSKQSAIDLLSKADAGELTKVSASDTAKRREDALTGLRSEGESQAKVADLVTKTFPSTDKGVPFYFERAVFEGKPAVIVIEAIGRKGSTLTDKRLWVLGEDGSVLLSGTR